VRTLVLAPSLGNCCLKCGNINPLPIGVSVSLTP
jgi:hypothetical protein